MSINMSYFKAIQGASELTSEVDLKIREEKNNLTTSMSKSLNYKPSAMRNGAKQPMLIMPTKIPYKCTIAAFPNDALFVGDVVFNEGEHWLVVETNITNPLQTIGTAWLCNQLFRFQNSTSTIVEKWGVLDSGMYSKSGDKQIQFVDNKYKIYLPLDSDTKKLFVDKRLATNKAFNSQGEEILTTYVITSFDSVSQNYGQGGHLLVLSIESGTYNANTDSLAELVCDYITSTGIKPKPGLLSCMMSNRSSLRTGTSFTYTATFYKSDGVTVDTSVEAVWSVLPVIEGITNVVTNNSIKITVANNESLCGKSFTLSLVDKGGLYNTATTKVEVI